jgi:ABC-type multidrug transport system fused ATPase/permease subunit
MTAADDVRIPEGDAVSSAVLFDRVSFAFDDHIVLRDISFSVPTGRSGLVRSESTHL